jgi:hypothetical protein
VQTENGICELGDLLIGRCGRRQPSGFSSAKNAGRKQITKENHIEGENQRTNNEVRAQDDAGLGGRAQPSIRTVSGTFLRVCP